jgi:hypothetical protein
MDAEARHKQLSAAIRRAAGRLADGPAYRPVIANGKLAAL